jgi:RNA polymerase sigma factor (TIGR02999 family)
MADPRKKQVTTLLQAVQAGDRGAAERLLALVYDHLYAMAKAHMARLPPGQTLEPTALVHEAYIRLFGKNHGHLVNRRHFFFAAARAMRDILVERARQKAGPRRGGGRHRVQLFAAISITEPPAEEVLALHEALNELEQLDPLKSQVVHLRYFTGMTAKETGDVLGLSERTVARHWHFIKAWLASRLAAQE